MTAREVQRQNERVIERKVGVEGEKQDKGLSRQALEVRGVPVSFGRTHRGVRRGGGSQDRQETGGGGRMCTESLSPSRALPS